MTPQLAPAERTSSPTATRGAWTAKGTRPPLGAEVLSEGNADNDLEVKVHLYAAMGVPEYFVYNLGDMRWRCSPWELLLFRPGADGAMSNSPRPRHTTAVWGLGCACGTTHRNCRTRRTA